MDYRLVDTGWDRELSQAMKADSNQVRIVCPFIKKSVVERLLKTVRRGTVQVITRFNLLDFAEGVSDIAALRYLLERGAQVRGVRNLHDLYVIGTKFPLKFFQSGRALTSVLSRRPEILAKINVKYGTGIKQVCDYYDLRSKRSAFAMSRPSLGEALSNNNRQANRLLKTKPKWLTTMENEVLEDADLGSLEEGLRNQHLYIITY